MRNFIFLFLIICSLEAIAGSPADSVNQKDQTLLKRFFEYANKNDIAKLPLNQRISAIGRYFIETPYVGGTLDINPQEELVVNLREFDCVTFVDNVIALALLDKYNEQSIPLFQNFEIKGYFVHQGKRRDSLPQQGFFYLAKLAKIPGFSAGLLPRGKNSLYRKGNQQKNILLYPERKSTSFHGTNKRRRYYFDHHKEKRA